MKILIEDEKEKTMLLSLCDICLKAGGITNLEGVQIILNSIEEVKE